MSSQAARSHMSIGEVLALLQGEFPDVTISKIRFLEGEGLIEPERTPSGFRKFTHLHVEQLRYILTEQRDHYLPLRVIKDKMAESFGRPPRAARQAGGQAHPGRAAGVRGARRGDAHRAGGLRAAGAGRPALRRGSAEDRPGRGRAGPLRPARPSSARRQGRGGAGGRSGRADGRAHTQTPQARRDR
ncbi:MerR family transcriptional regulator [Nonomuraea ferruginea]